jgi:GDPmannose 4,6-dehydratase
MADGNGLARLIREIRPTEVYNLAAQSHVRVSFDQPAYTADVTAVGTLRLLEAIRDFQDAIGLPDPLLPGLEFRDVWQGRGDAPAGDDAVLSAFSPYGVAKLYAHWITVNYRESYGCTARAGFSSITRVRGVARRS